MCEMESINLSAEIHLQGNLSVTANDDNFLSILYIKALIMVGIVLQPVFIFIGVVGNLINIVVFLKMRLVDSITLCFFFLSCSDLLSLLFLFALRFTTDFMPEDVRMDGLTIAYVIVFYYLMLYDVSQMLTSYIALQKCCCVALPFTFKSTFTRLRSSLVAACVAVSAIVMYLPIFTAQGIQVISDNATTRLTLWTTSSRSDVILAINFWGLLLPSVCQILVVASLIILASSLRSSSHFHKSISQKGDDKVAPERRATKGGKETQAVYVTSFVALIYVLCNTPRLMISYASLIEPEFNLFQLYTEIYIALNIFRNTIEAINTSLNIFVFLKFNRKYRRTFFVLSWCL
ncbi:G-protein coupled receptor C02B8.5 [Biomphalaria pfeifferi]|uniref:G-protein coupled receptor C02B8.5 n=1 Tax=Biomphalaria pfeifferi TaxID=112525 RepID=A0AAD8FFB6_BIOPF|nr:G-protein coupled receptor C02B8.5 [Biomphalaria pfeifferi]